MALALLNTHLLLELSFIDLNKKYTGYLARLNKNKITKITFLFILLVILTTSNLQFILKMPITAYSHGLY